jgi:energy-coupling factor transporter ATP-binding protein EcfA2
MATDWDKIANDAATATDAHFSSLISSLTRLNDDEIENVILETGISKQELASILKEVNDATKSNEAKATAINNIGKGMQTLVAIASKLI